MLPPALVKGNVVSVDLVSFRGQWVVLCFLAWSDTIERVVQDSPGGALAQAGAVCLAVVPDDQSFFRLRSSQWANLRVPLLADPLLRLHRAFGVPVSPSRSRCQSFLIDQTGLIQFHLVHRSEERAMDALVQLIFTGFRQAPQRAPISQSPSAVDERT
jgi:peroxiredoxin